MNRNHNRSIFRILVFVTALVFGYVFASAQQLPAAPTASVSAGPHLTQAEQTSFADMNKRFADLEAQRVEIVKKQQEVSEAFQKFAAAVASEYPGYVLDGQGTLVSKQEGQKLQRPTMPPEKK